MRDEGREKIYYDTHEDERMHHFLLGGGYRIYRELVKR